jgi:hypothetical protein
MIPIIGQSSSMFICEMFFAAPIVEFLHQQTDSGDFCPLEWDEAHSRRLVTTSASRPAPRLPQDMLQMSPSILPLRPSASIPYYFSPVHQIAQSSLHACCHSSCSSTTHGSAVLNAAPLLSISSASTAKRPDPIVCGRCGSGCNSKPQLLAAVPRSYSPNPLSLSPEQIGFRHSAPVAQDYPVAGA